MNDASGLSSMVALDPSGRPVRLGSFWEAKPVVLVFIRHFG
ncbi:MAG: hypothetical protein AB1640_00705 [bacterium]